MKATEKAILAALLGLLALAAAAILFTHDWATSPTQLNVNRRPMNRGQEPVSTAALQTALQLVPLAVTPAEQEFAQEAQRAQGDEDEHVEQGRRLQIEGRWLVVLDVKAPDRDQ